MYQAYWGLAESPFRGQMDTRYFYRGPTQDEALARLHFLVEERRTLGLVLGSAGSGKSLLLEVLKRELGRIARQTAHLSLVGLNVQEFQATLAAHLGIDVPPTASEARLARALSDHIIANRYQRVATVVLLDDVDEARDAVLEQVARLAQLDTARDSRLSVVISAPPDRLGRLGHRLLELVELRIDLEGWERDDTAGFLKSALATAGRTSQVFTDSGIDRLQSLSGGIPRRVKQLADLALLAGAGQNLAQIDAETVDSVYHELGVVATA